VWFVNIACFNAPVAGRLMRVESTPYGFFAYCECGWRALPRVQKASAVAAADRHREQSHPRQATFVASQRRRRAVNGGR
jgi:hypothetical protein